MGPMPANLAIDPRTKIKHTRSAREQLRDAREALASHSRWSVAKFLRVVREIMADPEESRKLKLDAITEYMDRCGLPKRVEFEANDDAFTAQEMRLIWREVCVAAAAQPNSEEELIRPIDADFEVIQGTNGAAGQGPRALPQPTQ